MQHKTFLRAGMVVMLLASIGVAGTTIAFRTAELLLTDSAVHPLPAELTVDNPPEPFLEIVAFQEVEAGLGIDSVAVPEDAGEALSGGQERSSASGGRGSGGAGPGLGAQGGSEGAEGSGQGGGGGSSGRGGSIAKSDGAAGTVAFGLDAPALAGLAAATGLSAGNNSSSRVGGRPMTPDHPGDDDDGGDDDGG